MLKKGKPAGPLTPAGGGPPADGSPIFGIVARSPVSGMVYPLATMGGDNQAKMLVNAMRTQWGRKMYAKTLNKGVARSVFNENGMRMLRKAIYRHAALRKYAIEDLEIGFTTIARDFEYPMQFIRPEEAMTLFQWLKMKLFGGKRPTADGRTSPTK